VLSHHPYYHRRLGQASDQASLQVRQQPSAPGHALCADGTEAQAAIAALRAALCVPSSGAPRVLSEASVTASVTS
jgi:hypothetical protein